MEIPDGIYLTTTVSVDDAPAVNASLRVETERDHRGRAGLRRWGVIISYPTVDDMPDLDMGRTPCSVVLDTEAGRCRGRARLIVLTIDDTGPHDVLLELVGDGPLTLDT